MIKHKFNCTIPDDPVSVADGQVVPSNWNDDHTISGGLDFPAEVVAAPTAGVIRQYAMQFCGKMMASAAVSKAEESYSLQQWLGTGRISMITPSIGATNLTTLGIIGMTTLGTASSPALGYSSKYSTINRVDYLQTVASTTNAAGVRYAANAWARTGTSAGFYSIIRAGVATGASNASSRFYAGMKGPSAAVTDVNPSTLTQHAGAGWDSTDANMQIMFNDASGTSTKIDLGSSWPVPVTDRSEIYDVHVYAPRAESYIYVCVVELTSGRMASAQITTDLFTVPVAPLAYASVGGVSDVTGLTFGLFYAETFA